MQHQPLHFIKNVKILCKTTWLCSGFVTHSTKSELTSHGEKVDMQEKQPNQIKEKVSRNEQTK